MQINVIQGTTGKTIVKAIHIAELLQQYEFRNNGTCNCNGIHTQKYRNKRFHLKIRIRRNAHRLYNVLDNTPATNWLSIIELKTILDELYKVDI